MVANDLGSLVQQVFRGFRWSHMGHIGFFTGMVLRIPCGGLSEVPCTIIVQGMFSKSDPGCVGKPNPYKPLPKLSFHDLLFHLTLQYWGRIPEAQTPIKAPSYPL